MTIRKGLPVRDYETFPSSTSSEAGQGSSDTRSNADTDKSRLSAAHEAQRLASQGSWADNVFQTPGTNLTPSASTIDEEDRSEMGRSQEDYPSEPPPQYTPSDTAASTIPSSPTTSRIDHVRTAVPQQRASTPPSSTSEEGEEEQSPLPSSPLLGERETSISPQEPVRWRKQDTTSRFKRASWFTIALLACLWLMLPSLLVDTPTTRAPHHPHAPHDPDDLDKTPIPTWPIPKREYRRHETSTSIHGTFSLYDVLELETTSGSIGITIDVKTGEKPAILRLKTNSGSISIRMAGESWLPWKPAPAVTTNRTFDVQLSTVSGSISGSVLAGNGGSTSLTTKSGSQSVTIHAIGVSKHNSTTRILTESGSGSQRIKLVSDSEGPVEAVTARHTTIGSGSLMIEYPRRWLGKVHAYISGSGHVTLSGSDLETSGGGSDVYGWRAEGNLDDLKEVEIHGEASGNIVFRC